MLQLLDLRRAQVHGLTGKPATETHRCTFRKALTLKAYCLVIQLINNKRILSQTASPYLPSPISLPPHLCSYKTNLDVVLVGLRLTKEVYLPLVMETILGTRNEEMTRVMCRSVVASLLITQIWKSSKCPPTLYQINLIQS